MRIARMRCREWIAVLAAGLALAGPLFAQQLERRAVPVGQGSHGAESAPGSRRIALVIGNGSYLNVARLPNPANDARLIGTWEVTRTEDGINVRADARDPHSLQRDPGNQQ